MEGKINFKDKTLVLVTHPKCQHCQILKAETPNYIKELSNIGWNFVDADVSLPENIKLFDQYGLKSFPHIMLFDNGGFQGATEVTHQTLLAIIEIIGERNGNFPV